MATTPITHKDIMAAGAAVRSAQRALDRAAKTRDQIARRAVKQGRSVREVAARLGCSQVTVRRALKG